MKGNPAQAPLDAVMDSIMACGPGTARDIVHHTGLHLSTVRLALRTLMSQDPPLVQEMGKSAPHQRAGGAAIYEMTYTRKAAA